MTLQRAAVTGAATASLLEPNWRPGVDSATMFPPDQVNGLGLYSIRYSPGAQLELHHHDPSNHTPEELEATPENTYFKDEWYIVESGSGEVTLDGTVHQVEAGNVVWIPRGTVHGVKAGPDGLHLWALAAWLDLVNADKASVK